MKSVNADNSTEVISKEQERLQKLQLIRKIEKIDYISHLIRAHNIETEEVIDILYKVKDIAELKSELNNQSSLNTDGEESTYGCMYDYENIDDINEARTVLNLPIFELTEEDIKKINDEPDILKELKRKLLEDRIKQKTKTNIKGRKNN